MNRSVCKRISWCHVLCGRYSSVGITTSYGLDGLGIESRWGRDFLNPSRPALGPTLAPVQWVLCIFPGGEGVKRPELGVYHLFNAVVKERVKVLLCLTSGPSWPVLRWPLSVPCRLWLASDLWRVVGRYFDNSEKRRISCEINTATPAK